MGFCVNIRDGGMGNTFQDAGRLGFRHQGMPASGFLDAPLAHCANALVGNPANATCVEMRVLGPTLVVTSGALRVAIAGQAQPVITRANSLQQPLLPWHSATLSEGDALRVGAIQNGCAYLSIAGGALLMFGSGPVRGFAVVHCLGILTSIFSSVVVSRCLVNLTYGNRKKLTKVAIGDTSWK